jgi:hypothetical protein
MTMASDEMRSVAELDTGLIVEMRRKLRILYSESGDMWVGNNSDHVIEVLAEPSHIKFAPIPHAFCLSNYIQFCDHSFTQGFHRSQHRSRRAMFAVDQTGPRQSRVLEYQ